MPVVDAGINRDHVEIRLEQIDCRQHPIAVQPVRIQTIGRIVRGHDKTDAQIEQSHQQPIKHHGIGDIAEVEFIEADQSVPLRHRGGHGVERVGRTFEQCEFGMDTAHELMEVNPRLADQPHIGKKLVHQEALAAPDPAPEIDAARNRRPCQQARQRVGALRLVRTPVVGQLLESINCVALRRIERVAARDRGRFHVGAKCHGQRAARRNAWIGMKVGNKAMISAA